MSEPERYSSRNAYLAALAERAKQVPAGFRFAVADTSFVPAELGAAGAAQAINLALILADAPTRSWTGVFTRNSVVGAPVTIARRALDAAQPLRGIPINNRVANVCAPDGSAAAAELLGAAAAAFSLSGDRLSGDQLLPASTGVIGWRLPVTALAAAAAQLPARLDTTTPTAVAEAIMTTDAYPKLRVATTAGGYHVLGIAKGAGMIEPNLATMLVFVLTDAPAGSRALTPLLRAAVDESFNRISVDSDQSTSDMVVLLSSADAPPEAPAADGLAAAVGEVCRQLAADVVRNGEGTRHVMQVTVTSCLPGSEAAGVGKAVINSPLVKTAIYGDDPNVGRIVMAVGDYLGNRGHTAHDLQVTVGGHLVFADGTFRIDGALESQLSGYLQACTCDTSAGFPPHHDAVELGIQVGLVAGTQPRSVTVQGADLGHEYVRENADYRS